MTGQEKKIRISELPASVTFRGLWTIGYQMVDGKKTSVRVSLSEIEDAYKNCLAATASVGDAVKRADDATDLANLAATETFAVKEATDKVRQDTQAVKEATEQVKTETETVRDETAQVKADTLSVKEATDKVRGDTLAVKEATEQVKSETETVRDETAQVKADTLAVKEATEQVRGDTLAVKKTTEQVKIDTETVRDETAQVKADTLAVKEATDQVRQDTQAVKEATEQVKSDTETVRDETAQVKADTLAVKEATDQVRQDTQTVKESTEQVKTETEAVKQNTEELNAHPMKIMGGIWFVWSLEKHEYENTGIQAKGDTGSSFKIIGRYDTLAELEEAVPDGTDIDGVYAIGAMEPFDYYAWLVVDGVWKWDNQGKLRGAEGKSSYEVWVEQPEHEGKTLDEYFDWLSPVIDPETGRWIVQGQDQGVQALGIDAEVTVKENTEDIYILHVKSAKGEFDTPNLRGFDVKVEELDTNTPDDYRLKITTAGSEFTTPNLQGRSGSAVIDIDHEPTEADIHYTYNGVQYAFSVGDEVRWYDKDLEEYVLFKLYAMTGAGAVWEEMGSGSGSLPEDVILTGPSDLSSDESDSYIYLKDGLLKGKEE
ncbi:hypothetical protein [uncultured Parabacteroides sp.]|uniref:hypothetical protein n=1 Tax=uncultured Parabacteroides sp. TaxID=512312 RepID=UPI002604CD23|nr:hypothetical protein [uncultured Parabacteroides sp.]